MALFIRFFVVIFAYGLASLAAGAVLVFSAIVPVVEVPFEGQAMPFLSFLILTTSGFIAMFSFVPAIVVILLSESFGWRSVLIFAVAGAAIGIFCGYIFGFFEWSPGPRIDLSLGGRVEPMAGAGVAAGIVYWLVAGRNAGAWRSMHTAKTGS